MPSSSALDITVHRYLPVGTTLEVLISRIQAICHQPQHAEVIVYSRALLDIEFHIQLIMKVGP